MTSYGSHETMQRMVCTGTNVSKLNFETLVPGTDVSFFEAEADELGNVASGVIGYVYYYCAGVTSVFF